jgi:F-type H+-transporting ATPase subunit delta
MIKKKFSSNSNNVMQGLLDYLSQTDQSKFLPEVTEQLNNLVFEKGQAKEVVVTSTKPFSQEQKEKIKNILSKFFNCDLPLINNISKNILGGFTIEVGDWFLDASLTHQLEMLKNKLLS